MSTPAPPSSSPVSFDEDLAFLSKYGAVKVLSSANGGRIAVSGQYQARVMTSAVGAGGRSLGFINRKFIATGQTATAFDNYGGEDRFWLGPEGGQYGLYFPAGKPFVFDNWQTPHAMQEGERRRWPRPREDRTRREPRRQGRKGTELWGTRAVKHAPDAVPGLACQMSWAVCARSR